MSVIYLMVKGVSRWIGDPVDIPMEGADGKGEGCRRDAVYRVNICVIHTVDRFELAFFYSSQSSIMCRHFSLFVQDAGRLVADRLHVLYGMIRSVLQAQI